MDEKSQDAQAQPNLGSANWKSQKDFALNLKVDDPKWYSEEEKKGLFSILLTKIMKKPAVKTSYEDYFAIQLRLIYTRLDTSLRYRIPRFSDLTGEGTRASLDTIGGNISELFNHAKGILELEKPTKKQLITASSFLNEIDEQLVWLSPLSQVLEQIPVLLSKLAELDLPNKDIYVSKLTKCLEILENAKKEPIGEAEAEHCRASLAECIRVVNTQTLNYNINTGLQIERLRTLLHWGMFLLVLFILIFPMVSKVDNWPPYVYLTRNWSIAASNLLIATSNSTIATINNTSPFLHPLIYATGAWLTALGFCIIGGIAGFLSGLLQVRESKTDLGVYEMSVLLFQLRPVFGAFAALVTFMLLSWGVFKDIIASTPSSYTLVAFVSGFSERYFIKLLKLDNEGKIADTNDIKSADIPSKEKDSEVK